MHRLALLITMLAVGCLAYIGGAGAVYFDGPLGAYLKRSFKLLDTKQDGAGDFQYGAENANILTGALTLQPEDTFNPPLPGLPFGTATFVAAAVQPGYTLYTPVFPGMPVRLIDFSGASIHEWQVPQSINDFPRADDVSFPHEVTPAITDMHLYANGNLLVVTGHDTGASPWGFGIVLLDKSSNIIWAHMKQTHHQIDVAEDGRIALLLNRWITEPLAGVEKIATPILDDAVSILSATGDELVTISVLDAFLSSEWRGILKYISPVRLGADLFHTNSVSFLSADQASLLPNAEAGDLLISLRNIDVVAVLDPQQQVIKWALRGPWHLQHDPQLLANGNLLVFDNHGDMQRGGRSRVIEVNPLTMQIAWEWPGTNGFDLYSSICGSVERLDNGNTLITESNRGRLLEVTRQGEIVWEYVVPETIKFANGHVSTRVLHTQRVDPASLNFIE